MYLFSVNLNVLTFKWSHIPAIKFAKITQINKYFMYIKVCQWVNK